MGKSEFITIFKNRLSGLFHKLDPIKTQRFPALIAEFAILITSDSLPFLIATV